MSRLLFGAAALTLALATTASAATAAKGRILVVLSGASNLPLNNGKVHPTGYYLNELGVPAERLTDAGYTLVIATPEGKLPTLDPGSDSAVFFHGNEADRIATKTFLSRLPGLSAPRSLSDVAAEGVDGYAAIFIPGGHAPMIDLMADPELGRILRAAHNQGKITAAICHGPVALAAATQQPAAFQRAMANNELIDAVDLAGAWPYRGYKMTVFSRAEEAQAQQGFGGSPLFNTQTALEVAGANVQEAGAWYPAAIRDRELITGQNPFSDEVFSDLLLKALSEPKA